MKKTTNFSKKLKNGSAMVVSYDTNSKSYICDVAGVAVTGYTLQRIVPQGTICAKLSCASGAYGLTADEWSEIRDLAPTPLWMLADREYQAGYDKIVKTAAAGETIR